MLTLQQEREALEKLLSDSTRLYNEYSYKIASAQTPQQEVRLVQRQTQYAALRTLVGNLMLG